MRFFLLLLLSVSTALGQNIISSPNWIRSGGLLPQQRWATCTFDASANTVLATAHGLSAGAAVIFKSTATLPTCTGDVWSSTTVSPGRLYYVYNITADTFQIVDFAGDTGATDITGTGSGTHSFQRATRRDLVFNVELNGAITAQTADSTISGGNARGGYALDLQRARMAANQVAEPAYSTILNGFENRITTQSGATGTLYGAGNAILSGFKNTITSNGFGAVVVGWNNSLTGQNAFVSGYGNTVQNPGSGGSMTCLGNIHLGGCQDGFFGGGFHNLINSYGTTDLGATGAQINAIGSGTALIGAGGFNMQAFGAGVHAYWQGCEHRTNHGNKNKAMIRGNLIYASADGIGTIANGATRTDELFLMGYYPTMTVSDQSTGVNTGTEIITYHAAAPAANTQVRVSSTGTLPGGLSADTAYYVVSPSGSTSQLSTSSGGAAVNLTSTGSGVMHVITAYLNTSAGPRWCRLFPSKLYTFDFTVVSSLVSPTTPAYAVWRRRATFLQEATNGVAPTLVGAVETVGTDVGSNAGTPPASWAVGITGSETGVHVTVTILNNDGTARNHHTTAAFECVEISN